MEPNTNPTNPGAQNQGSATPPAGAQPPQPPAGPAIPSGPDVAGPAASSPSPLPSVAPARNKKPMIIIVLVVVLVVLGAVLMASL